MFSKRALYLLFIVAILHPSISTAQTCPAGQEPITAENRELARAASIPDSAVCWKPNIAAAGMNEAQAKQYLVSLPKQALSQCAPPIPENIQGLNGTFAICAAQFLKAYTERYGPIVITSAFRSEAPGTAKDGSGRSANQCAGGVSGSNHTRGVAMDLKPQDERMYPTIWKFASDNPQFGVCFPFQNNPIPGYPNGDRPHMILAGIGGSEGARCAAQGVTKPCSGLPINITNTPVQPSNTSPTAAFAQSIRQAFGMPTQQTQVTTGQQPAISTQPVSVSQSPLSAFEDTPTVTGVSSQISGDTTASGSSTAADRLEELAFGPKATSTQSATSVPLVVSGQNAASLTGTQQASSSSVTIIPGVTSPSQTTFVSPDLSWQGDATISGSPVSGAQAILITIKAALTRMLTYLTPFGSRSLDTFGESGE